MLAFRRVLFALIIVSLFGLQPSMRAEAPNPSVMPSTGSHYSVRTPLAQPRPSPPPEVVGGTPVAVRASDVELGGGVTAARAQANDARASRSPRTEDEARADAPGWQTECVDCPKRFADMTGRSLRLDAAGQPHIAYGYDHLYYAWRDGSSWHLQTVDSAGGVGSFASLALDGAGRPHISYYDVINCDLRYAHWTGSAWQIETVDSEGGQYTSLALDSAGSPHISYYDATNRDLKYAHWTSGAWQIETVDSEWGWGVGQYTSLALDSSDNPHISYYGYSDLKYARRTGSAWQIKTVDSGWVGAYTSLALDAGDQPPQIYSGTSLALDAGDHPHISYCVSQGSSYGDLKYAHWTGSAWKIETVNRWGVGEYTSLALDAGDHPHISYVSQSVSYGDLKYAHWTGSAWKIETVNRWGVGAYTSLALDAGGYPHITYYDWGNRALKYARWVGSAWKIETVDSEGDVGQYTSLALDVGGNPHVSYCDIINYDLKYARWMGSAWRIETVDSETAGMSPSLAVDADGHPCISYCDGSNGTLKYARWTSSAWQIETVDGAWDVGLDTSLALDADGHPHISYSGRGGLKYAHWTGSAWQIETVDGALNVDYYTSLALDAGSHPHISYYDYDWPNGALKYARWTGSTWITETVDSRGGGFTSLALDAGGHPHISYYYRYYDYDLANGDLKYARWTGSAWITETVDSGGWGLGAYTSLALDVAGHPHISYYGYVDLKYARWTGSAWITETVDSGGNVGEYTSLALDAGGNPHISYYDGTNGDLKYTKRLSLSRTLSLLPGWNLISLPLAPANTDITQALASIASRYDRVYAYDAAQSWTSYDASKPPFLNSLTAVSETQGLWIRVSDSVSLTITGTLPVNPTIPLKQGWNLVGYPSQTTRPVTEALASIAGQYDLVYAYDAANAASPWRKYNVAAPAFLNTLKELGPGLGYWIRATQDCTWLVP